MDKTFIPTDGGTLTAVLGFFSFWMGACIASFLNVVIWRVPRGESIVRPPSHCPKCGASIRWCQNIPILSWLALRGKCANCRAPISPRYILVETLGGLLFLAAFMRFGTSGELVPAALGTLVAWIWISLMIVGSMIDFDHQLLPDFVTVGGMALGVLYHGANSAMLLAGGGDVRLLECPVVWSVIGLVFGFGLLWLVRLVGSKVFGREAMGMGDVFLMGAVGALYGPVAVLATLMLSSVLGSIVGLTMVAISKIRLGSFSAIPYGPYICLGCLCWMFYGAELLAWYMGVLGIRA